MFSGEGAASALAMGQVGNDYNPRLIDGAVDDTQIQHDATVV